MTTGEMQKHRMRALLAECSEAQRGQISAEKSKRVAQKELQMALQGFAVEQQHREHDVMEWQSMSADLMAQLQRSKDRVRALEAQNSSLKEQLHTPDHTRKQPPQPNLTELETAEQASVAENVKRLQYFATELQWLSRSGEQLKQRQLHHSQEVKTLAMGEEWLRQNMERFRHLSAGYVEQLMAVSEDQEKLRQQEDGLQTRASGLARSLEGLKLVGMVLEQEQLHQLQRDRYIRLAQEHQLGPSVVSHLSLCLALICSLL